MSPERICVASASVTMISFSVDKDLQTSALVCPLLAFFMASVESSPSPVSLCGQGPADFTSHLYALFYWRSLWLMWNRHHRQFHCGQGPADIGLRKSFFNTLHGQRNFVTLTSVSVGKDPQTSAFLFVILYGQ